MIAMKTSRKAPQPDGNAADGLRQWMDDGLRGLAPDASILALGCEEAFLAPHLLEYASDVTVLDTSGGQIAQRGRRFPEIAFLPHHPANPLPFSHGTFDAIWCCEFLDRVFDPAAALREMHRVLAPGGRLLVTVANHDRVRNVLIALFAWDEHFAPSNPRIRYFTRRTLAKITREAGFADIHLATTNARRLHAGFAPRSLLLKAKKAPGLALTRADSRGTIEPVLFDEDLAYAGRTRAA
jgi:SAM-dependent methyltransferase